MPHGQILLAANVPVTTLRQVGALLERSGYAVLTATRGADAVRLLERVRPDLVILDLTLSTMDSVETLRAMRRISDIPVILLATPARDADLLLAFASGADDHLTKPFNPEELVARIGAVLARVRSVSLEACEAMLRYPGVDVDLEHRTVTVEGTEVHLSATEWTLLALLGAHAGRVMRHSELLWPMRGPEYGADTQYLRTWISRVRTKLESKGSPSLITTHPGIGYRLAAPPDPETRAER